MKRLFTVVALLFLAMQPAVEAQVQWRTWEQAVSEAQKNGKIIMVDAVRTGCHYCDDMDKAVFEDSAFAAYLEERFIPVKVNLSHTQMPHGIYVQMTPSFYFFRPDETLIKTVPGSWNQEDFRSFLEGIRK